MVKKKLSMPIKIGLIIGALLLAVILIIIVCKCCREHYDNQNTIFVSIASYRDKQCHGTLKDLYDKAKYPKNIRVCICDQWKEKDELCGTIKKYKDNITTLKLASTEARGPIYARALINTHYHDEKYFLMIDSHSKFDKDWDVNLISQIKELQKKSFHPHAKYSHSLPYPRQDKDKVVITSYVKDYKDRNNDLNFQLCKTINSSDFPAQFDSVAKRNKDKFKQQMYIAGGLCFTIGEFVCDVRFPASLAGIFNGEEIYLSLTAYCKGYDVFSQKRNCIYHNYNLDGRKQYTQDNAEQQKTLDVKSKNNLLDLLYKIKLNCTKGRTRERFWKLIGWNRKTKKIDPKVENFWCNDSPEY